MAKKKLNPFAGHSKFRDFQEHLKRRPESGDLEWEYYLGELVSEICPPGSRGSVGIPGLAGVCGGGQVLQNRLWNARAVYANFDLAALRKVQAAAKAAKFSVGVSHVTSVMSLSKRPRTRMLTRCVREKLTVTELRREVRKLQGGRKRSGGGVPPATPKSIENALDEIIEHSSTWLKRCDIAWFHGETAVFGEPVDARTMERLRAKVEQTEEILGRLRLAAHRGRTILQSQRQR